MCSLMLTLLLLGFQGTGLEDAGRSSQLLSSFFQQTWTQQQSTLLYAPVADRTICKVCPRIHCNPLNTYGTPPRGLWNNNLGSMQSPLFSVPEIALLPFPNSFDPCCRRKILGGNWRCWKKIAEKIYWKLLWGRIMAGGERVKKTLSPPYSPKQTLHIFQILLSVVTFRTRKTVGGKNDT